MVESAAHWRETLHATVVLDWSPASCTVPVSADSTNGSADRHYRTMSGLTVVSDPQRSNQSIPSQTRSNFNA